MKPPGGHVAARLVMTGFLWSLFPGGPAAPESSPAAQVAEEPIPIFASGPIPLRGPTGERKGDVAELCATSLNSAPAEFLLELRDATKAAEVLNASKVALAPGQGACLSYIEQAQDSRRVVGIVAGVAGSDWRALSRSVAATTTIRDGASNTILIAEAFPKVATFSLESSGPGDGLDAALDSRGRLPLSQPTPVYVAGPLYVDGPSLERTDNADRVEVCATNLATADVEFTMQLVDSEKTGEVLASLRGVLGPGEGTCLPYLEQQLASRRVLSLVSSVVESTWSRARRSLLSTASVTDGTTHAVMLTESHPAIALSLPAVQ